MMNNLKTFTGLNLKHDHNLGLFISYDSKFHLIYDMEKVNMYESGNGLICTFTGDKMLEVALDVLNSKKEIED